MLIFKLQGIVWDLSVMRLNYKLTKGTTKTEKFEKFLKKYNTKNFMTNRYELSASLTSSFND